MFIGFCGCSKGVYSSVKENINWKIEIGVPCRLGNPPPWASVLLTSKCLLSSHINQWSQSLLCSVPWFRFFSCGSSATYVTLRFFYEPAHRKDNSFLLLLYKKFILAHTVFYCFLAFIALETWQVLTKKPRVGRLESFLNSPRVGL